MHARLIGSAPLPTSIDPGRTAAASIAAAAANAIAKANGKAKANSDAKVEVDSADNGSGHGNGNGNGHGDGKRNADGRCWTPFAAGRCDIFEPPRPKTGTTHSPLRAARFEITPRHDARARDQAFRLIEDPNWSGFVREESDLRDFFSLEPRVQRAMVVQFGHHLVPSASRALLALSHQAWLTNLELSDQVRAVRAIAHLGAQLTAASREPADFSPRRILQRTLEALVGPTARLRLAFEDLPNDAKEAILGLSRAPDTILLNRRCIKADDARIGDGALGAAEAHVALTTLVHEADHLTRSVRPGPTYAAFQDEYCAWFTGFLASEGVVPRKKVALLEIQEILSSAAYRPIHEAIDQKTEEGEKILAYLQTFGAARSRQDVLALSCDNCVEPAPKPDLAVLGASLALATRNL